jgi:hypothetical protein
MTIQAARNLLDSVENRRLFESSEAGAEAKVSALLLIVDGDVISCQAEYDQTDHEFVPTPDMTDQIKRLRTRHGR